MLRIQLFNERLGTLNVEDDPDGLSEVEQIMKRSRESDGIMYEVTMDLEFYKRAYEFIQTVYETGGIEEIILVNLYEYDPNAFKWKLYNTGKIALKRYTITETRLKTNIEQTGFETKVINLRDVDVDLDAVLSRGGKSIPATPFLSLPYHSKKILRQFAGVNDLLSSDEPTILGAHTIYFPIPLVPSLNEIEKYFGDGYGYQKSELDPTTVDKYDFLLSEAGQYTLNIARIVNRVRGIGLGFIDVEITIDLYHGTPGALTHVELFNSSTVDHDLSSELLIPIDISPGQFVLNMDVGDVIYLFLKINATSVIGVNWDVYNHNPDDTSLQTSITLDASTLTPPSSARTVMVYEALNKISQYITDQTDAFRSEFFGRTDSILAYDNDGDGSLVGLTNGRCLRGVENQTMFHSLRDLFESLSARFCLGWGVETDPDTGAQYIRIEQREYFYNKELQILELGCVSDLEKTVAMDYYYNRIEYGYPKLDLGEINAIDEFNTLRRADTPITQTNSQLKIVSKIKTSGYEIESVRRLAGTTKDSKLDDANFFISMVRDGGSFRPKTNDGYSTIQNLFDPEGAYNLDFRPGKMIRAWARVIAANVIKLATKTIKFTYGEGNYELVARGADDVADIDEGADVDLTDVEPIWEPETYKFTHPLTRDQMRLIRENKYGYIRFMDTAGNKKDGFVLEIRHDPNKNMGEFTLLKVFRPVPIT